MQLVEPDNIDKAVSRSVSISSSVSECLQAEEDNRHCTK